MKYLLSILLSFSFLGQIFSQNPITISHEDTLFMAGKLCGIMPDNERILKIEDVINAPDFKQNEADRILMGAGNAESVWLKYTIQNASEEKAFFELMFPLIDTATFYVVDSGRVLEIQQTGQNQQFAHRTLSAITLFLR